MGALNWTKLNLFFLNQNIRMNLNQSKFWLVYPIQNSEHLVSQILSMTIVLGLYALINNKE